MKKTLLAIFLIFAISTVYSQEKVLELPESFSTSNRSNKKSYTFRNQKNGDLMLLLEDKKQFAYLLSSDYLQKSKITTKAFSYKFPNIIGHTIFNNSYSIFYSNTKNTKFGIQTFDFENKTSSNISLDLKIKGEKYVESINHNNKIHIITISKKSSNLNIYILDKSFHPEKKIISLKQLEYPNPSDKHHTINAYYLLLSDAGGLSSPIIDITKIESGNPNAIEITSNENKLYKFKNKIVFSFDYSNKETRICSINLDTFISTIKIFDKPSKHEKNFEYSNSYIFNNKLFQIASSNKKMKFTVLDLTTGKLIKEYSFTKEDSITFKNSPILEKGKSVYGSSQRKTREVEKTAKFLRRVSGGHLGISAHKIDNSYIVTLGGTTNFVSSRSFKTGLGNSFNHDGTVGNSIPITINHNPTFYGYSGYSTTSSTYINCLFDENFEHQQGDIPKNIYDKVNDFEGTLKKPLAKNIFLHKDNIHFGFFDKKDRIYKLYRFED